MRLRDRTFIEIRNARPEELAPVAELVLAAYEEFESSLPPEFLVSFTENIDETLRRKETEVIVAAIGGQIVGTVTLYAGGAPYGADALPSDWAAMRLLAVHPESRRRGVGRALTLECLRRARERELSTMLLHTLPSMTDAHAMYESLGFLRVAELDADLTDEVRVLAYRLDLKRNAS
jgi:ribosomal protein S18 acetylase RimI-like enzyme